jgi:hypothetical protein
LPPDGRRSSDPRELASLLEEDDATGPAVEARGSAREQHKEVRAAALGNLLENEIANAQADMAPPDVSDLSLRTKNPIAGAAHVPAAPAPAAKGAGGGAMKYVVLAVVILLGAGAAAWFGKLIPH